MGENINSLRDEYLSKKIAARKKLTVVTKLLPWRNVRRDITRAAASIRKVACSFGQDGILKSPLSRAIPFEAGVSHCAVDERA